jgi:cell wall-associated NlpC family hydrolase
MPLLSTSSRRAGLACFLVLAALWAPASALAAPSAGAPRSGPGPLGALGRTVLAAIENSSAGDAMDALGNSLALLGARYRVEGRSAGPAASEQPSPKPAPQPSDPATLPPASAGSNGTTVPHASALSRQQIFAHTRPGADPESTAILLTGVALAPPNAPEAVKGAINAANTIVGRPYVWGGGHGSFYSAGYDCSGSVSFALFGGGLIPRPLTSSELEHWGAPGPGRWITVYANGGHTFAEIAGLRWDTVGDEQGSGPRWHLATASADGFVVRHPPGL